MSVVGFDIGNESCVIAAASHGRVDILMNDELKLETPSVVSFGEKQRLFGSAGAASALANPKSTISQVKRLIGRQYKEPCVQKDLMLLPFVTSEGPRGGILIELEYMKEKMMFTPVEILGMLFKHLKQIAEKNLESGVIDCVIGIPSYFTDLQRREYLDAATIAGLKPLTLMHDGTAIALGYGMYKTNVDAEQIFIVFVDNGHSDTQVTVAEFKQGQMKILAHSFDNDLGGRDFDEVIFKHFAAQIEEKYKIDVSSNARASIRLRASCEKVKKVLSFNTEACLNIDCLLEVEDVRGIITREEFENLSRKLLERVTDPCVKAVHDSGISHDKIYTIELVGSGSHIPAIMKRLTSLFQKKPITTLNTTECVARGCALRCAMLSPTLKVRDYEVQECFPYSIGARLDECNNIKYQTITVIPKCSPFPVGETFTHLTNTTFYLHISYINETDLPAGISPKVGHFMMGLSHTSGAEKVKVLFKVELNKHGIVEIRFATALEDERPSHKNLLYSKKTEANKLRTSNIAFSDNLYATTTKDELLIAQEREQKLLEQDKKVEQTKDQRNTLKSFVYDTRSKLQNAYKMFVTDLENEGITKSLQETEDWLYEDSDDECDEQIYIGKLEDLKKLLEPIENKYKDENKMQATKPLLAMIEENRLVADSLPFENKIKLIYACKEVEQYLSGHSPKNFERISWSNLIKETMGIFKRHCKEAIQYKPSSPEHPETMESDRGCNHVDAKQTGESMDGNRTGNSMDRNRTAKPVERNQTSKPVKPDETSKLVKPDETSKPVKPDQTSKPVKPDPTSKPVKPDQTSKSVKPVHGNQTGKPVKQDQTSKPVKPDQSSKPVDGNQTCKPVRPDQTSKSVIDSSQSSVKEKYCWTNVTRTDRGGIKDFGVSENVLVERRQNKLREAQVTKQMPAEKDIQVEQTKEKIHGSELSGPVENENKDEIARQQATKQMLHKLHEAQVTKQMLAEKDIQVEQTKEKIHGSEALSYHNDEFKEADSEKLGNPVQVSKNTLPLSY